MNRSSDLIRSIRLQLGQDRGYGVTVEASDVQLAHAVRLALAEYSRYFPIRSHQSFQAPKGMNIYHPSPAIRGIEEFTYVPTMQGQLASPEVALLGGRLSTLGSSFQFSSPRAWAIYVQWSKVAKTVFSANPDWRFVPEDGNLYLYVPTEDIKVSIVGTMNLDVAFDEEGDPTELVDPLDDKGAPLQTERLDAALLGVRPQHLVWIRKLAFAKAKEILGYMRRKFQGIPGADKQQINMDGNDLVREGVDLWERTMKDLLRSVPLITPSLG